MSLKNVVLSLPQCSSCPLVSVTYKREIYGFSLVRWTQWTPKKLASKANIWIILLRKVCLGKSVSISLSLSPFISISPSFKSSMSKYLLAFVKFQRLRFFSHGTFFFHLQMLKKCQKSKMQNIFEMSYIHSAGELIFWIAFALIFLSSVHLSLVIYSVKWEIDQIIALGGADWS